MGVDRPIDITAGQRKTLLALLKRHLPNTTAWVYGSRVKWTSRPQSDLDLVVFTTPDQERRVSELREAFEESNLPFRVDLLVWRTIPEQYRKQIEADHVALVGKRNKDNVISGWREVPVSEIASAVIGGTPARDVAEYWGGDIPWATAKDLSAVSSRYLDQVNECITEQGLKSSAAKLMPQGTVVITARGTVGALGQLRRAMTFNQTCYAILPNDGLDGDFLFWALKGTLSKMRSFTYGTIFETITKQTFDQWHIPFPPLLDQRAIAHVLGTLDDKIELNRRMNETLEAMARALFKSWFIDFDPVRAKAALKNRSTLERESPNAPSGITPPLRGSRQAKGASPQARRWGDEGGAKHISLSERGCPLPHQPSPYGSASATPPQGGSDWTVERARAYLDSMIPEVADLFPDRLVDSELGPIPEGWEVVPLPEIIEVNPTRSLQKGEIAPYLDMANMPTRGHAPDMLIDRPFGSGMRFTNGDTLVARITPCLENGKTAYVDFLKNDEVGWGSTEYIVMRPKPPLPNEFAYCLARSVGFREFAIQSMTGTSGRQRVPAIALSQFLLPSPPKQIAAIFGRVAQPLFSRSGEAVHECRNLAALRDTLLPKLISGELCIPEAEKLVGTAV